MSTEMNRVNKSLDEVLRISRKEYRRAVTKAEAEGF